MREVQTIFCIPLMCLHSSNDYKQIKLFAPKLLNTVENTPACQIEGGGKTGSSFQNGENCDIGYSDNRLYRRNSQFLDRR